MIFDILKSIDKNKLYKSEKHKEKMNGLRKIISVIFLMMFCISVSGCGNAYVQTAGKDNAYKKQAPVVEGEELLCLCETQEDAEAIAEQYSVELVTFSYGVATFHTDKDLDELIQNGIKSGLPELSKNYISNLN